MKCEQKVLQLDSDTTWLVFHRFGCLFSLSEFVNIEHKIFNSDRLRLRKNWVSKFLAANIELWTKGFLTWLWHYLVGFSQIWVPFSLSELVNIEYKIFNTDRLWLRKNWWHDFWLWKVNCEQKVLQLDSDTTWLVFHRFRCLFLCLNLWTLNTRF